MLTINNMLLRIGNTGFANWTRVLPYFVFEFSEPDIVPSSSLYSTEKGYSGIWTQVSSTPNRWKLEIERFVEVYDGGSNLGMGLARLFCPDSNIASKLIPSRLGGGTCKIIDSGNLDIVDANGNTCQSMDRMFTNCTGLTEFSTMQCSNVINVGGMFSGCTEVTEGAYDQYVWFNTYATNVNNHSGTFTDCGSNTQTGVAELAQIPVGWGGTLVPASTLMTSTRVGGSNYTCWTINSNNPTWTDVKNGMYLFTEASVSRYAGVSMNRGRINGIHNGLGTTQATYALYFYPSFFQVNSGIPGTTGTDITWIVTTNTPNGNLTVGQANTDMPGTLDYGAYGSFAREYGTYDSNSVVYFGFLTTNVPIDQWSGLTDAYGLLYNNNYNKDARLRWFF